MYTVCILYYCSFYAGGTDYHQVYGNHVLCFPNVKVLTEGEPVDCDI